MKELAVLLRVMKLYAHAAHNLASGPSFFADHAALSEFYEVYDTDYDDVIERIIGLYGAASVDLSETQVLAVAKMKLLPLKTDNTERFKIVLSLEQELYKLIDSLEKHPELTCGTQQLITEIANKSEMRQYKIKQRLQ